MGHSVYLTCMEDQSSGEVGMVLEELVRNTNLSNGGHIMVTSEGLGIAHDIMEHQNGAASIGRIDDEMQALAAMWLVRGQFGDLRRDRVGSRYTPAENMAYDIKRMYRDWVEGDKTIANPGKPLRGDPDACCGEVLDWCQPRELHKFAEVEGSDNTRLAAAQDYYARLVYYTGLGVQKATARCNKLYGGSFARYNAQFWAIADAVDPMIGYAGQGSRWVLTYGGGEATLREVSDW